RWPRDWSSDVCSSDLGGAHRDGVRPYRPRIQLTRALPVTRMGRAQVTPQQLGCLPMKQALARGEDSQGSMRRGRPPLQAARRDHDLRLMRSFYRISLLSSAQGSPFEIATRVLREFARTMRFRRAEIILLDR